MSPTLRRALQAANLRYTPHHFETSMQPSSLAVTPDDERAFASESRRAVVTAKQPCASSLEDWARRISVQPEIVVTRELAGLGEEQLHGLEEAFRQRPRWSLARAWRWLVGTGLGLLAGSVAGLEWARHDAQYLVPALVLMGVAVLVAGAGGVLSLAHQPVQAGYLKAGLCASVLDEQHPWLYRTLLLMRDPGAEAYRQKVLRERGKLRGVDYLMMREIASVSESLALTQPARSVFERVQSLQGRVPALAKQEALVDAGWASTGQG